MSHVHITLNNPTLTGSPRTPALLDSNNCHPFTIFLGMAAPVHNDRRTSLYPKLSILEHTLLVGGHSFSSHLFDSWPAESIIRLAQTSFILWNVFQAYTSHAWNLNVALTGWFPNCTRLIRLLGETSAILCGPAVIKFFDRKQIGNNNIDICVAADGLDPLVRFLLDNMYTHEKSLDFTSSTRTDTEQRNFGFVFGADKHCEHSVTLHVVQGDPVEFLLSSSSSTFFNPNDLPLATTYHRV